jgi:hypothetical protein
MFDHINRFPHCDPRILHAPGECGYCDSRPEWQDLRKAWQIAFTGHKPEALAEPRHLTLEQVLPCPADFIRGDTHIMWGGNVARPAQPQADGDSYGKVD